MPDLNLGSLTIECPSLDDDGAIPLRFVASGDNIPPVLEWSGVPATAAELALVVHDPDAPLVDGFTHWVVFGISPGIRRIDRGEFDSDGARVIVGRNSAGDASYMGPAPPDGHGRHHYYFHLYAIDEPLDTAEALTRAELLEKVDGHIVEQARVVGTYEQ